MKSKRIKMVEDHKKNKLFLTGVKYYQSSESNGRFIGVLTKQQISMNFRKTKKTRPTILHRPITPSSRTRAAIRWKKSENY